MARPYKFNTTTANLGISAAQPFYAVGSLGESGPGIVGLAATNSTGQAYYVKFWWTGQTNLSYAQISAVMTNAACTIVPSMTVEIPTTGLVASLHWPLMNQGQLYLWAVSTAADGTNTSLSAGGDVITVFVD